MKIQFSSPFKVLITCSYCITVLLEEMSLCNAKTLNGFVVVVFDSGFSLFSRLLVYF